MGSKPKTFREKVAKILVGYDKRYTVASLSIIVDKILSAYEVEIKRLKEAEMALPKPTKKKFNIKKFVKAAKKVRKTFTDEEIAKFQKRRIGLSFWKWFYSTGNETTEDAIERITGVKDGRFDAKTKG